MNYKVMLLTGIAAVALAAGPAARAQCGCGGAHARGRGAGNGWQKGAGAGPRVAQRIYDPATVTTLKGTVTAVEVQPAVPGRPGGMHIVLQSDQKSTEVHIGPAWFAQAEGLAFTKGESAEVTGSLVQRGNNTFLVAREVKRAGQEVKLREADGTPLWSRRPR